MEKTNVFQDFWRFIKKWFNTLVSFLALVAAVLNIGDGVISYNAGDLQSTIMFYVIGFSFLILSGLFAIIEFLSSHFLPAVPDKS